MPPDEAELFLRRMQEEGFPAPRYERLTILRSAREYALAKGATLEGAIFSAFPTGVYVEWGEVRFSGLRAESRWLDGVDLGSALDWFRLHRKAS